MRGSMRPDRAGGTTTGSATGMVASAPLSADVATSGALVSAAEWGCDRLSAYALGGVVRECPASLFALQERVPQHGAPVSRCPPHQPVNRHGPHRSLGMTALLQSSRADLEIILAPMASLAREVL